MEILRHEQAELIQAYGILCSSRPKRGDREGLYATFCQIPPNGQTIPHAHFEPELFYIINGNGIITIDSESEQVKKGDLIHIPPFSYHVLKNIDIEDLVFISIYSEDTQIASLPSSVMITSAPPTPNGPLHLGHISGPYLASDIIARYLRMRSIKVCTHSGTDDHQNYVDEKAHFLQSTPDYLRKLMRSRIQKGLQTMQIEFNEFIEPKIDKNYQDRIINFVERAIKLDIIKNEKINLPYCTRCSLTLMDALIDAICPFCQSVSHGSCENCGMVVPPQHLQNPTCSRCKSPADQQLVSVYTFELSKYFPAIQDEISQLSFSPRLKKLIESVGKKNDFKMIVTYPNATSQGLCLSGSNQVIHVWFEMAAHYEKFSLNQTYWIHCFGFDNAFYYLVFIPALLRAINAKTKLPDAFITNDFLLLKGSKFSTSRDHAIWADEFTDNIDNLRLYLSMHRPAEFADDFTIENYKRFSLELDQQLQHLNERAEMIAKYQQITVHSKKLIHCNRIMRDMEFFLSPRHFDLRCASRKLIAFIDDVTQAKDTDGSERLMLHTLGVIMSPFMPKESDRLLTSLNENLRMWIRDWSNIYEVA